MQRNQRGGAVIGFIFGVLVGLVTALAVAVYVTKVPVPFLNKVSSRGVDQDAAEAQKNRNWDPNSPLYGRNPARPPASSASAAASAPIPAASVSLAVAPSAPASEMRAAASQPKPAASKPVSADPLGDLAVSRSAAAADSFDYFVQAGAFRSQTDADAQRAKLAMLGWEARVSEREQNGQPVFRVRVGPFSKREDAEQLKDKLDGTGVQAALVRVPR